MSIRFRSLPIFWQTLLLLQTALVMALVVSIMLIIYLPAPRPDFYTMTEITERLALERGSLAKLIVRHVDAEPVADEGMISDPAITRRLAAALGRPDDDVRLFFQADQSEIFPFTREPGSGAVPIRHGQPYFFNTVDAAERESARQRLARAADAAAVAHHCVAAAHDDLVRRLGDGDAALRLAVRAAAGAPDPALRRGGRAARPRSRRAAGADRGAGRARDDRGCAQRDARAPARQPARAHRDDRRDRA